jgi:hypothetical protein
MNIPPHLQVAKGVTEEDYQRAKRQSKYLNIIMMAGFLIGIPLGYLYHVEKIAIAEASQDVNAMVKSLFRPFFIVMMTGLVLRVIAMGSYCKDAYKLGTLKYKKYPELRDFKKRNNIV